MLCVAGSIVSRVARCGRGVGGKGGSLSSESPVKVVVVNRKAVLGESREKYIGEEKINGESKQIRDAGVPLLGTCRAGKPNVEAASRGW